MLQSAYDWSGKIDSDECAETAEQQPEASRKVFSSCLVSLSAASTEGQKGVINSAAAPNGAYLAAAGTPRSESVRMKEASRAI